MERVQKNDRNRLSDVQVNDLLFLAIFGHTKTRKRMLKNQVFAGSD